tara:strand:- start:2834 stop:3508 length:675 start_codon:yes stop_codon:yes gene_type:complete
MILKNKIITDHTILIEEGMTTFPVYWHPFVEITQLGRHGIENRESRKITLGTHTGTNLDAPKHFIDGGSSIEEVSPEILLSEAFMINLSKKEKRAEINIKDLDQIKGEKYSTLILFFDWCKYLGKKNYYVDHPYLSEEAAEFIVEQGIKLIGMDTPMPDNPENGKDSINDSPIHKILLSNNCLILECLQNLKKIKENHFTLFVAPLKIKGGDGATSRVFSIQNK